MPFEQSVAVGQSQPRLNSRFVPQDASSKGLQFCNSAGLDLREPGIKPLPLTLTDHVPKTLKQGIDPVGGGTGLPECRESLLFFFHELAGFW